MSRESSLLKARYCLTVLKTASMSPDPEARRLIACLATEQPTLGLTAQVAQAELERVFALRMLAERLQDCSISSVSAEWHRAQNALLRWMVAAT